MADKGDHLSGGVYGLIDTIVDIGAEVAIGAGWLAFGGAALRYSGPVWRWMAQRAEVGAGRWLEARLAPTREQLARVEMLARNLQPQLEGLRERVERVESDAAVTRELLEEHLGRIDTRLDQLFTMRRRGL